MARNGFVGKVATNARVKSSIGVVLFFGLAGLACAQSEDHPVTVHAGGGITTITGFDAGRLDHGGNFQAGVGHFFNRYFGITGNFMFNDLGITRHELNLLNQPDGSARVYSLTADPTLRIPMGEGWSAYLLAGGGYLRRTVEFTRPTLAETIVFDPWWGYFGPALIPVHQILGSVISNSGAVNAGGGLNIPLPKAGPKGVHVYVEARYFHGFTSNSKTTIVPITFGVRW